jgi:hypothetical protein
VGRAKYACILAVEVAQPTSPAYFRQRLGIHEELAHVTVEINR